MRGGEILDGRFELVKRAGLGGMAAVWRALDRSTGQPVALKVLRDAEGRYAARFRHEARVLACLDHPHIVRYVAHGIGPSGELYLVMEWLEGESLSERLARSWLDLEETMDLARRVAAALGAAHARGVVHRDIKPSNLLLVDGRVEKVKVLDFGVARQAGTTGEITRSGSIVGTPGYMAPEQARGEHAVGPRADIFSFGCVLFECLTGRPAFQGAHLMALLAKLLFDEPPRLADLRAEIPHALSALIPRMLAKDPSARPADGAGLLAALERLGAEGGQPHSGVEREAITDTERRIVSIVAVLPPPGRAASEEATGAPGDLVDVIRRVAVPLGARVEELANGAVVAALLGEGGAVDQAAAAARCALWIRAAAPGAMLVLVTGRGETTMRLPVGEALERAAVLLDEGAKGPRTFVRLDDVTRALLDPRFDVIEEDGQILLRNERRTGEETRTLLGKPSPFVGREKELRIILDLLEDSFEEPRSIAVIVTGPPGVGKSRLRQELIRIIRQRHADVSITTARPEALGSGSAFSMISAALRDMLQITSGEPFEAQKEKVRQAVYAFHTGEDAKRLAEFLGELAGAPFPDEDSPRLRAARQSPQLMVDQIQSAYVDLLEAILGRRPALTIVDDLHWGDAPSIKILDTALRDLTERRFAVLAFARPEINQLFPLLWDGRNVQVIRLGPLSRRSSRELVESTLGADVEPARVTAILERAEGNALYLEELIRAVAEGRGDALPDTILGMVEARLSALTSEARRLLRAASVFGQVFWKNGAQSLLGDEPALDGLLSDLCAGEVIGRRALSRFAGEEEYVFRHALIREGAYAMLTDRDRGLGHRLAGEWLERAGEPDATVLAEHLQRGQELERAAVHYLRAGSQSFDRDDLDGALLRARRGIECGVKGEVLGNLLALSAMTHCWRSELDAGYRTSCAALPLVGRGSRWECIVLFHGTWASVVLAAEDTFAEMADRFVRFEPNAEARREYLLWAPLAASLLQTYGWREICSALLDRAEELASTMPSLELGLAGALAVGRSDYVRAFERDPWRQLELTRQAVEAFQAIEDLRNQITALNRLGQAEAELGDPAAGEETLRRGVSLAHRIQVPFAQRQSALHLAALLSHGADASKWAEAERTARSLLGTSGVSAGYRGWAHGICAEVLLQRGLHDEAVLEAREAHALCGRVPLRQVWVTALMVRGLVLQGELEQARKAARFIEPALDRLGGGGYVEIEARLSLAEARFADGQIEAAHATLRATMHQIEGRAAVIPDAAWRARYMEHVPEITRARALAAAWGVA